jgi:hypothetical protein
MRELLRFTATLCFFIVPMQWASAQAVRLAADPGPMAKQVRSEFLYAWNAYKQYAWGHDELKPLSQGYRDWYDKPLYITPVTPWTP